MATSQVDPDETNPTPFTEQEPFLWDSHRYYGYISGVGAGKTAIGVMRDALNMEYWNPGYMGAIVAPTTQMIKNSILPLMREFGLMERWEYKGPQAEMPGIQSPNGSRAVILSANNERQIERLASMNLAWWHLDENKDINPRARQILIQRLRDGEYANGYVTTTPKGKNHDYDFFVGDYKDTYICPQCGGRVAPVENEGRSCRECDSVFKLEELEPQLKERTHGEATLYETEDRLAITGVPTDANPHLDRDDVQAIRDAHPSGLLQQEVEGKFIEVGSGLLTRDMLSFVDSNELPDRQAKWVLGVDIGVQADAAKADQQDSDYWACAILAVDTVRNEAYLMDVQRKRGMTLRQGLQWLRGISKSVGNPEVAIESNQAQRFFSQEAKEQGLRVTQVQNTTNKEDRIVQLSIPFENGTIRLLDANDGRFNEFVNEWIAFPEGTHDDVLDSVEIAVSNAPIEGIGSFFGGNFYEDK